MNVGSLFAGIGGFDLGLERAGMRVVWQCEQDDYCRRVLAKHWPGVPCYPDVRGLVADPKRGGHNGFKGGTRGNDANGSAPRREEGTDRPRDDGAGGLVPVPVPYVDVLCGGFPCQDISVAGRGIGIGGSRSGLWSEFARLIGELRPRYVIVENVPALLARGMGRVLGDLAALGYDAEWDCIPASALGAPHRRDRVWIVAYPNGEGPQSANGAGVVADPDRPPRSAERAASEALPRSEEIERSGRCGGSEGSPWATEPDLGRVAHGVPARVDRLRALGNALVPQIAEWIGQRIMEYEREDG